MFARSWRQPLTEAVIDKSTCVMPLEEEGERERVAVLTARITFGQHLTAKAKRARLVDACREIFGSDGNNSQSNGVESNPPAEPIN